MNLNNIHDLSRVLLIVVPPLALLFFAFPVWYFTQKVVSYEMRTAVRLAAFCSAVMPMFMFDPEGGGHWFPAPVLLLLSIFNPLFLALFLVQLLIPWSCLCGIFVGRHWWINRTMAVPKRLIVKGVAAVLMVSLLVGIVTHGSFSLFFFLLSGTGPGTSGAYLSLSMGLLAAVLTFLAVAARWRAQQELREGEKHG